MSRFRKKPVVIEAKRLTNRNQAGLSEREHNEAHDEIAAWCGGRRQSTRLGDAIVINTLEGEMRATPGDWVIKGVQGEFYPCKHGIFEATYDAVKEGATP